ncbi:MAG: PEP-utilizing enzyme, partial [Verrucomicrobiota bacterium]
DEILEMLAGRTGFPRTYLIETRKASYERAAQRRPAYRYIGQQPCAEEPTKIEREGNTLTGVAASAGVSTGQVCIVESEEDLSRFQPGNVLVTTSPKPAWTPLYAVASGLVTSSGSTLSHGLISAREYRLPAVIGLPGVIDELANGQEVTVDGNQGVVLVHE